MLLSPKSVNTFRKGRERWGKNGGAGFAAAHWPQASGTGRESHCPWQGCLVRPGSAAPSLWPQAKAASARCSCRTTMGATIRPIHGALKVPQIISCWQLSLPIPSGCKVCAPQPPHLPVLGPGSPRAALKEGKVPAPLHCSALLLELRWLINPRPDVPYPTPPKHLPLCPQLGNG